MDQKTPNEVEARLLKKLNEVTAIERKPIRTVMFMSSLIGQLFASFMGDIKDSSDILKGRDPAGLSEWRKKQNARPKYVGSAPYLDPVRGKQLADRRLNRAVARMQRLRAAGHDLDASSIPNHIKRNAALAAQMMK